jgi:hypothetical protein
LKLDPPEESTDLVIYYASEVAEHVISTWEENVRLLDEAVDRTA